MSVGPSPRLARSAAAEVAAKTASGSSPSTRTPGKPKASPRRQISPADWRSAGTEIAQPLFWQKKTTGARNTPAKLNASDASPSEVAPSPK